jgi:hypothetical protein
MKRFGICTIFVLTTIAFAARTPNTPKPAEQVTA